MDAGLLDARLLQISSSQLSTTTSSACNWLTVTSQIHISAADDVPWLQVIKMAGCAQQHLCAQTTLSQHNCRRIAIVDSFGRVEAWRR